MKEEEEKFQRGGQVTVRLCSLDATTCASSLLALLLVLMLPALARAQFSYITNNDTIAITGYAGTDGTVFIPDSINGLPVTRIAGLAFNHLANLTDIVIPGSVTHIETSAFHSCPSLGAITVDALNSNYNSMDGVLFNKALTELVRCPGGRIGDYQIPNGITNILNGAFQDCARITGVSMANSVVTIENHAFQYCFGLTNITLPESVVSIGDWAFGLCDGLTQISIPKGTASLGSQAFAACTGLKGVHISESVTNIGYHAFDSCSSLAAIIVDPLNQIYSSELGVLFDKNQTALIQCPGAKMGSYEVPNGVTSIHAGAFSYCNSLTDVTIPSSVTNIADWAFSNSAKLEDITVDSLNSFYASIAGVLFNQSQTVLIQCPGGKTGHYVVPASTTAVEKYAFAHCARLTEIIISDAVTNLGNAAFSSCTSLTNVILGSSVASLGDLAFYYCPKLTTITIPRSTKMIGGWIFASCSELRSVYFQSDAPAAWEPFQGNQYVTVYYLPNTFGWGPNFWGRPTAPWSPEIRLSSGGFDTQTNRFGFNIVWAEGMTVVVDAATNLAGPVWLPLQTNTLTDDLSYFSDPEWTNYPSRFYRLRWP